jgi:hypothetical protein
MPKEQKVTLDEVVEVMGAEVRKEWISTSIFFRRQFHLTPWVTPS